MRRRAGAGARGCRVALSRACRHTALASGRNLHIRALNQYQEANPGVDLTFIPLDDPTNTKPWYDADIEVLCRAAADARKSILAGKKVAFLCKAGLNRSPTLARMASHGMNIVGVAMPVDEALCELALCDLEDPSALAKLTPVGMRKQRKRSRPDA